MSGIAQTLRDMPQTSCSSRMYVQNFRSWQGTCTIWSDMNASRFIRLTTRGLAAGIELTVASYAAYAGITWCRYGRPRPPSGPIEIDSLLDTFMPTYEVVERHRVQIAAPAGITLSAAYEMDLQQSAIICGIFRARELVLCSQPNGTPERPGLLARAKALGWGVLAETPGREIVMGAVT